MQNIEYTVLKCVINLNWNIHWLFIKIIWAKAQIFILKVQTLNEPDTCFVVWQYDASHDSFIAVNPVTSPEVLDLREFRECGILEVM